MPKSLAMGGILLHVFMPDQGLETSTFTPDTRAWSWDSTFTPDFSDPQGSPVHVTNRHHSCLISGVMAQFHVTNCTFMPESHQTAWLDHCHTLYYAQLSDHELSSTETEHDISFQLNIWDVQSHNLVRSQVGPLSQEVWKWAAPETKPS